MNIEEKLSLIRFNPDGKEHPHLKIIDERKCRDCKDKPCVNFCPAHTYEVEKEKLTISYENCLECGSCRIACPQKNIDWQYPRAGFGVTYRYG